ncbi:hypothetical protein CRG98_033991 [Punica granatum]|uniref:Uncharacterized protein n=1 Tax=Punica granatum TaxID=22663 RepID=A0A2I0INU4_PUNGR|nr:hypothetical protein CRG98_033991 [Punica granatum]
MALHEWSQVGSSPDVRGRIWLSGRVSPSSPDSIPCNRCPCNNGIRAVLLQAFPHTTLRLLGQASLVDVRQDSSVGDGHRAQELAQLFIVPHRNLRVFSKL